METIMRVVFLFFLAFGFIGCSVQSDKILTVENRLVSSINTRDTCIKILTQHLAEDTFLYQQFYDEMRFKLSYIKTGHFIYPDKKSGVIIYTPTDSTIAIELYIFKNNRWFLTDKKVDLQTDWLMFYTNYADYNFDGINDVYINIIVSNGLGLSTGYLLTVNEVGSLTSHPETIEIRDMSPDSTTKTINAHIGLYCKDDKSICDEKYQWKDNRLTRISLPCECPK